MLYAVRHGAVVARTLGKAQGSRFLPEPVRPTAVASSCENVKACGLRILWGVPSKFEQNGVPGTGDTTDGWIFDRKSHRDLFRWSFLAFLVPMQRIGVARFNRHCRSYDLHGGG